MFLMSFQSEITFAQCCCKNQKVLYLLKIQDMIRLKSIVYLFSLLLSATALHAQPLYVGEFNIRNDNAKDAVAGNGWCLMTLMCLTTRC